MCKRAKLSVAARLACLYLKYTEEAGLRSPTQAGFRPGLSTLHPAFVLQHFVDKHIKRRQPLFACFIDLKGAYDRVQRPLLWATLQNLGLGSRMQQAVRSLYADPQLSMNVAGRHGPLRKSTLGVKQGCPLSPTLFGLFLDGLDAYLRRTVPEAGPHLRTGEGVPDLAYADDITLLAKSAAELQLLIDAVDAYCRLVGMELSKDKTKVMVFGEGTGSSFVWVCAGAPLEQVQEFKYLGLVFSAQRGLPAALAKLKQKAAGAWGLLREQYDDLYCSTHAPLMYRLYQAVVPPTGSYGCELWGMRRLHSDAETQRRSLEQFHHSCLKQICGVRTTVPADMVLLELGLEPITWSWWMQTIRFWNQLAELPAANLYKRVALDDIADAIRSDVRNWAWSVRKTMDDVGYTLPWQEGRMTSIQPALVLQLLRSAWWDRLRAVDVCPRTAASRGTKLCTYMRWFARPEHSLGCTVLDMSVRPQQLRAFMRFRLGCHDLPIEAGRHAGIARQHRTCTRCTLGVVGDEKHLLLECPAAQRIRDEVLGTRICLPILSRP